MNNINFVVHTLNKKNAGGVVKVVTTLANCFSQDKDLNVTIYSISKIEDELAFLLSPKVKLVSLNIENFATDTYKGIAKLLWFKECMQAFKPILKHLNLKNQIWLPTSPPLNMLFSLMKYFFPGLKIVGCDHTSTIFSKGRLVDGLKYSLLKKMDYIVALTQEDHQIYLQKGLNSVVIPNFTTEKLSTDIVDRRYVLYVGRFDALKQPLLALKCYHHANMHAKGIKLKMFGHGNLQSEMVDYIQTHNLENHVEIINHETNFDKIYQDGYALIMTSKIEGLPMVLLEAINNNIPCVVFDIPNGPKNVIEHGENGFLVPAFDEKKFIAYLSSDEIKTLHTKDISSTLQQYSKENVLKIWMQVFANLGK